VPPGPASRPARVFELRTYEARSATALERKIAMFNEAEIALFRSLDMIRCLRREPVRHPSTQPDVHADLRGHDRALQGVERLRREPDWQRINKDEKYAATGSVTVTNVAYLRPLAFSPVR